MTFYLAALLVDLHSGDGEPLCWTIFGAHFGYQHLLLAFLSRITGNDWGQVYCAVALEGVV